MPSRPSHITVALRAPRSGTIDEPIFNEPWLRFMYYSPAGAMLRHALLRTRLFSSLYGRLNRAARSARKIRHFIDTYGIDTRELDRPIEAFPSFDAFFTRRLRQGARPIDATPERLVSPADARLIAYRADHDRVFPVKGRDFSLDALIGKPGIAHEYVGGTVVVLRLAPFDYHRFGYLDDATVGRAWSTGHLYEAVHPYALWANARSFTVNVRDCCVLHTRHFGKVLHIDVGALGVGAITQFSWPGAHVERGQEKGLFSLGGSTIVLVFQRGMVRLDEDLETHSANGIETLVRYGEGIGFPHADH